MKLFRSSLVIGLLAMLAVACSKDKAPDAPPPPAAKEPVAAKPPVAAPAAVVGQPAPDFKLKDLQGNEVSLSALKGKTVVLEWFNPQCPYVNKSHTKGGLVATAKRATDTGVVWLAINSAAPGKQGYEVAANEDAVKTFGLTHPVLRDETGAVGHAYGASNTPHMFVIDAAGTLVYAGAIDNSPDGEGESPEGGKLINYIDQALGDLAAGRPVAVPTSRPYGCSVKYSS